MQFWLYSRNFVATINKLAFIIRKIVKKSNLIQLRKYTILILIALVCNFILSKFADNFRFNSEFRWIYSNGKPLTLFLFFLLLALSVANGILIMKETNITLKTRLLWTIVSLSVFLYFSITMIIAMLQ
jgi:hypothetical protein